MPPSDYAISETGMRRSSQPPDDDRRLRGDCVPVLLDRTGSRGALMPGGKGRGEIARKGGALTSSSAPIRSHTAAIGPGIALLL